MKYIIISIFMSLLSLITFAQEKSNIMVSYNYHNPNLRTGNIDLKNQYILIANPNISKFYSPKTEYIDSLNSTPEGKAVLNQMTEAAVLNDEYDKIPSKDGSFYVWKSPTNLLYFDIVGTDKFYNEDIRANIDWEIGDSTKCILGYNCILAKCTYHGRNWEVWFTPDISIQDGPWKLCGLPGLILEAIDTKQQYHFIATGIQQSRNEISPIPLSNDYEKIERKEFWKIKRAFLANPVGKLKAQLGSDIQATTENGEAPKFVSKKVVDFIETDYDN